MAGGNSIGKYQTVPVNGMMITALHTFIHSDIPYQTLLSPGLLPGRATVSEMVIKCGSVLDRMLDKYKKYKSAGVAKDERQALSLGNFVEDIESAKNFLIAQRWATAPEASTNKSITRSKLMGFLNQWFSHHKTRIGWSATTSKVVTIPDPRVKPDKDPRKRKYMQYNLSDRYNRPFSKCLVPYVQAEPRLAHLRYANISVAQAETILLRKVSQYVNENDAVVFSPDNKDESYAFSIIQTLSGFPTEMSQTFEGVKRSAIAAYTSLMALSEQQKKRERLKLEEIKTEKQAQEKEAELLRDKAAREDRRSRYERMEKEAASKIDLTKIINSSTY